MQKAQFLAKAWLQFEKLHMQSDILQMQSGILQMQTGTLQMQSGVLQMQSDTLHLQFYVLQCLAKPINSHSNCYFQQKYRMHFLAHYYTELPATNPLFVAALAIPDLTPRFTKTYNSLIVKHPLPEDENLQHIHRGIVQHFGADKNFHHSPLFLHHVSQALACFLKAGLNRERLRLSVIAHIAVEMMIDRHIIMENENICTQYYTLLEKADETILTSYFDFFLLTNEKQNFLRSFQFYKQRKFLFLFKDLENIVFGLNKVYGSVTKIEFTETEKRNFLTALHNIDNQMRYSWQEILKR